MTEIDQIETILELPHPPGKVWHALTTPDGLNQWFGDRVTMTLEVGRTIRFEWDRYGEASGIIEIVEPMARFAYRWRAHGVSQEAALDETNSTFVLFELNPIPTGTRLRVVESGFAKLDPGLRERAFKENTSGWATELAELVDFLKGQPV